MLIRHGALGRWLRFWAGVMLHWIVDGLVLGVPLYLFVIFHNSYPKLSCLGAGLFGAAIWRAWKGRWD